MILIIVLTFHYYKRYQFGMFIIHLGHPVSEVMFFLPKTDLADWKYLISATKKNADVRGASGGGWGR